MKNKKKKRLSEIHKEKMARLAKESMYLHDDKSMYESSLRTGIPYPVIRSIVSEDYKPTYLDQMEQRVIALGGRVELLIFGKNNKEIKDKDNES